MRRYLLLFLLAVSFGKVKSCEKICEFLYNDTDWESHTSKSDTFFEETVEKGTITGIITASFDVFSDLYNYGDTKDFLRFYAWPSGEPKQPLFFRIVYRESKTYFRLRGKDSADKMVGDIAKTVNGKAANIQISDQNSDNYRIYLGDPGNAKSVDYNLGSTDTWNKFQRGGLRLQDTVRIKNDGTITVYKYMSVCSDPTPRICEGQQTVTETVNLSSSHTLTCTGSGTPYLDVEWTKDGELTSLVPRNTESETTSQPDHKIESTITISRVTIDHLGTWTCTFRNKNFGNTASKTYTLQYTSTVSLHSSPDLDYYKNNGGKTEFQWVVKGWPLEQVILDCGSAPVSRNESRFTTIIPPQITLILTLSNQDVVNCALNDGDRNLDTHQITRVGYTCVAGEGGVGKECEVCPKGQTSVAGVGECSSATSYCKEKKWGIEKNCQPCPENQTSKNGTVKIQECFPDISECDEGKYGYGNVCTACPKGHTSYPNTKKKTDCFPDVSNCSESQYGYGNNCTACPKGHTSYPNTKKKTDCFPDVSNCSESQYGYGTDCTSCQKGHTSYPNTKKETGCFHDISNCDEGSYGYGTDCIECPHGQTSYPKTKKKSACFSDMSLCKEGQYGYETNCTLCPEGKTSNPATKQVQGCVERQANLSIPIGAGAGGLVFVLAIILVVFLVARKRKQEGSKSPRDDLITTSRPPITELDAHIAPHTVACSESDSQNCDATYAVINKPVTVNRFKATGKSSYGRAEDEPKINTENPSDETYAVLHRGPKEKLPYVTKESNSPSASHTKAVPTIHDNHQLEVLYSNHTAVNLQDSGTEDSSLNDIEDVSYATLGEVKRVSPLVEDEAGSVYACLHRSERTKSQKTRENMKSSCPSGDKNEAQDENNLYAQIGDRKLNNPHVRTGTMEEVDELYANSDKFSSPRAPRRSAKREEEDEEEEEEEEEEAAGDATYATVELVQKSRLSLKKRASVRPIEKESVDYCTIAELKQSTDVEGTYINMNNE